MENLLGLESCGKGASISARHSPGFIDSIRLQAVGSTG